MQDFGKLWLIKAVWKLTRDGDKNSEKRRVEKRVYCQQAISLTRTSKAEKTRFLKGGIICEKYHVTTNFNKKNLLKYWNGWVGGG